MKLIDMLLITTAIFVGLMAGFFFSYSSSVSLGLGKLGDKEFLNAMQQINKEVENPVFFMCFFGSLVLLGVSVFWFKNQAGFPFLLLAFFSYFLGVFLVTVFVNVPLNNQLDGFDLLTATDISAKEMRNIFEKKWNWWNTIRTLSSILSLVFVILTCVQKAR